MPVNSLNFSNVVMLKNYLITPATTDANNFDVYQLDHKDSYEITRVITSFNGYKLVNNNGITDDYGGRNDLGIIMKMLVIDNILYVGYESGDLLALNIDFEPPIIITKANDAPSTGKLSAFLKQSKTVINRDPKITLVDHINIHAPNPIISLSHSNNHIIAGSTTNKLSLDHDILKLNNSGIQSILPTHKVLLIGYWNGIIEGYSDNQCVFTNKRQLPRVNILDSNKGNAKQENSLLVKLTFMVSRDKIESKAVSKYSIKQKFTDQELVFVGFEDGTIYVYIVS
ncbi:uncharacterized protein SPAPADRAFT_63415 [Spathaspora passalidarum NRRL Y-27907]|uniref:Uncharacterized protein n=1 Tax=Spathaspora passalidarum (strain NRRL Y-27907 / 11-Y1) TaxID=619300 RepID=G3AUM2_SPAPN|nr:uncharacterized protein SPAPADRAFT_63415 [Spathaspora passalidarum NRRL Y-27907]EGW30578.1 hypothetical protein SPAPADRAFT_63415 [Spathaspora passalidarum NRRL Y-27907]